MRKSKQLPTPEQRLSTPEQLAAVYAAVVHSALDAVIVVDEQGIVVTMNKAAEDLFGYTSAEAIGKNIVDLIIPDHLKTAHETGMARYRATRKPRAVGRRVEMEARRSDGRVFPVELAITEVILPEGNFFTANLRDLTSARSAAAEIERQHQALSQSEKLAAIGSLLAGVAHELNNPLSIVLGQSALLRGEIGEAATSVVDRVAKIEAAGDRCARIVRSFLDIARQRKAERHAFPVVPLLDKAIELLEYGFRSAGIEIIREFPLVDLPEAVADPDQVQNIITNLLVNALQVLETMPGKRKITIGVTRQDQSLRILIADNGPGIAPEHARRIFDPFFTTKPQGIGTGIGLSISRGLAEAQGGQLTMVDLPACGAAFELVLPAAENPSIKGACDTVTTRPAQIPDAQVRRVLVVDDEPEVALLLAELLGKSGYQCDVVASGREGQAVIAAQPTAFDLILCDLRMPDVDGPAFFRWLKDNHAVLADRLVFVTGDALGPAAGRFLSEAKRPVLEKPFTAVDLTDVLRTLS